MSEYHIQYPETAYWHNENEHLWLIPHKCGSTSFRTAGFRFRRYRGEEPKITFLVMRHPLERLVSGLSCGPRRTPHITLADARWRDKTIYPVSKQYEGIEPDVVLRLEDSGLWMPTLMAEWGYPPIGHENRGRRRRPLHEYTGEWSALMEYYDEDFTLWERGEQWQDDIRRFSGDS